MALNTIGNLASQSDIERYVFGRATFAMAVLTAHDAYRGSPDHPILTSQEAPTRCPYYPAEGT